MCAISPTPSPYSDAQWQQIDQLGCLVEQRLQALGVGLTMGGEPTFVSMDDFESSQWRIEALGADKRAIAGKLLVQLERHFAKTGALLHYGIGKWYPGETLPRWALGCYWRKTGSPIWQCAELRAEDQRVYGHTATHAHTFIQILVQRLGLDPAHILTARNPQLEAIAGYVLPLLPVFHAGHLCWSTCRWVCETENPDPASLLLLAGDAAMGLRLPFGAIAWADDLAQEALPLLDHTFTTLSAPLTVAANSIRVALSLEVRQGVLCVFLPPLSTACSYLELLKAIEATAEVLQLPVLLEGYAPPRNADIVGFQITPDPGVLEVNIHPADTWQDLVEIHQVLDQTARRCHLSTEKYTVEGQRIGTGGGAHITIGGKTMADSPLLRRPDLLHSLISYWQNHPALSYLFCGQFVGPTSQAPRVDEARHESLYELEIAFQQLQPHQPLPAAVIDRLLRNLLIDVTGNTHRTEFCIDKLFPIHNPNMQLGLLEFRGFEMPPHEHLRLLQMLLIRALVAWFWECPYTQPLIRWGTMLHDRFLLPHYIAEDLQQVLSDLQQAGFAFDQQWFQPFFEFRFPPYGTISLRSPSGVMHLELRHAIEPWHVLGEEVHSGSTARYADASMERIQVMLKGAIAHSPNPENFSSRYAVLCNGHVVPLKSTGIAGEYVGGVRFRARSAANVLHPSIDPHTPLRFELVDRWQGRSLGACKYHTRSSDNIDYIHFPRHAQEAAERMAARFQAIAPTPDPIPIPSLHLNPEYPLTLDLRRDPNA
jgi:uncharacterized protein (DUF2126 family)